MKFANKTSITGEKTSQNKRITRSGAKNRHAEQCEEGPPRRRDLLRGKSLLISSSCLVEGTYKRDTLLHILGGEKLQTTLDFRQ